MRLVFLFLITVSLATTLRAQEPVLPSNSPLPADQADPATSPTPAPSLMPATPAPLLPPASSSPSLPGIPAAPDLKQLDEAFKQTSLGKASEEYRLHVEWRRLQNRVGDDPDLIAAKARANAARTDLEKRKLLRAYYEMYYSRMAALAPAPDVKQYIMSQKAAHLAATAQNQVRPSPSPSPSAKPAR